MNRLFALAVVAALAGCCSYSRLGRDVEGVRVDGRTPVATYEVVNVSYKLLGFVPLTTGQTWKKGPYSSRVGGMTVFCGDCDLDDNLASVRHACGTVGSDSLCNVTGRVDDYWAWSCFLVRKRVVKTSCLIVR